MTFGERLRDLRQAAGYTSQQALGAALGVAQSTVANWERGRREPDFTLTIRIARLLDVSTDYLLGLTDQPHSGVVSESQLRDALLGSVTGMSEEEREDMWEDVREYAHYKLQHYNRTRGGQAR